MLRLVLGTDWIANREDILQRIADEVARQRPGCILMVPELISHDTERRLCAAAGDTASRYAEVLSFPRLLRRVAERQGTVPPGCMDSGGRLTAMASATRALASELKSYAAVETRPEFLSGMVEAVDEFKRCCITPGDLAAASADATGTLAQKLRELSLILESYDSICAQGLRDPRDQMNWLLEELEDGDFAGTHRFYIDGFPDFTRQHMAIVLHLVRHSPEVTVSLNCDKPGSQAVAFEKAGDTALELLREAQRLDIPCEIVQVSQRGDGLEYLRLGLFEGDVERREELVHRLRLRRSESLFDEVDAAAEQVARLVTAGCRYRDIGIVCADMAQYRGIVSLVFRRCGIPLYLSGSDDILEKTAVATVLSALDAAMDGLDRGDVLRYLRSVLSPLTPDECDAVENYAVLWGIRGEKWNREWTGHPDGLGGVESEASRQRLAQLNELRSRGIGPLVRLRTGLRGARLLQEQVDALYDFLCDIRLAQGLEELARQAELLGDNRSAQEYNQLWEILLGAMEQLRDTLGQTQWDAEVFSRLFRLLLSQYDVGTIPPVLDAVTVGPVDFMRCQQVRHLIVLGAQEGKLPGYAGSSGVLTDQERTALRDLGVPLTGGAMEGVAAEFAAIYGVFCAATETVTVSYSGGQSAFLYRRLCGMVGLRDGESAEPGPGAGGAQPWEAGAYLARFRASGVADRLNVREGFDDVTARAAFSLGALRPEQTQRLYGKKLTLSASQIDRQAECRMAYFLRYGLRARERKEATVDPAEFGTFVHWVLEQTAKDVMARGGFHQVSLDDTVHTARGFAEAYAGEHFAGLDSQRTAYLLRRNGQELDAVVRELWQELSQSKFEPVAFELHFARDGQMPAIRIPGREMEAELRGFVDRVDQWSDGYRNFFRVVDYKTGQKDFDYCDVFNGVGLQMLLYLYALESGGEAVLGEKPVSAGVQYFPARYAYLTADGHLEPEEAQKEREKKLRRAGLLLNDEAVLEAMDAQEPYRYLSCKRRSDGTLVGDLADRAQLKLLKEYLMDLLADQVDTIARGEVSPNPYTRGSSHNACAYCPYGAVCAGEREAGRRNYKTMDSKRFWEEIGRKERGNEN